jgi:hypothetical protein
MSRALRTIALCGALLAAGCGDSDDPPDRDSAALGSPDIQTSTREADCRDWNVASVEDRQVIVKSMAEYEGGATGTVGRTLPDDEAYELFERACEPQYAGAFKLYKVYARAAAIEGTQP